VSSLISLPSTHPDLAEFRAMALEMAARPSSSPPLKKIVGVGAIYVPDYEKGQTQGLSADDKVWLREVFKFCAENNLTISPDFTFTPVNLFEGVNRQDFLDPAFSIPADILISCYVDTPSVGTGRTSLRHSRAAWRAAARKTGARLMVAFSSGWAEHYDVRAVDLESPGYRCGPIRTVGRYRMETLMREDKYAPA